MNDETVGTLVVTATLAVVTLAVGIVIWLAAVRAQVDRVTPVTTITVPCCAAGVSGHSEGATP